MRRRGRADYRDMPWKNGGGVTRELVRWPHPTQPERFRVRLSVATVSASGPFSLFPGVDRLLLVLEGDGVALTPPGAAPDAPGEVLLGPDTPPFAFPGETAWDCRLRGGPVRDFNVMVERGLARATLERVRLGAGATHRLDAGPGTLWLYGVEGRVRVAGEPLAEDELLEWEQPGPLVVSGDTPALLLVVRGVFRDA